MPAVVAAIATAVVVGVIIPTVAASIVIVVTPILVAHIYPLLLVHELIGLEGVQRHLLGLGDLVALLDGCLNCLTVHVHLIFHLWVLVPMLLASFVNLF